jgi:hypothetical protein
MNSRSLACQIFSTSMHAQSAAPEEVGVGDGNLHSAAAKEALPQNLHRIPPHQQRTQPGRVPKDLVVRQRLQAA